MFAVIKLGKFILIPLHALGNLEAESKIAFWCWWVFVNGSNLLWVFADWMIMTVGSVDFV